MVAPLTPVAKRAALSLAAGGRTNPVKAENNPPVVFCSGERDLDRWFRREILPLEPMLVRFLNRNWRDRSEISDLQQEAYIRVCEAARRACPIHAKPFLFLIVRNLMIDRLRQKRIVSIETMTDFEWLGMSADDPTPEEHVMARQELGLLQEALNALPPRCRQVLVLRKIDGHSQRDVAQRMGITEETVEHQLAKGLRVLARAVVCARTQRVPKNGPLPVRPKKTTVYPVLSPALALS